MKFKLNQILESTILLEGRKEDAIKKYGEEHKVMITHLSNGDPSGNNKYLDWMVKTSLGFNQDTDIPTSDFIISIVTDFHDQLARIKNKDINSYKGYAELKSVVDEAKKKEEDKRVSKQAKKVYEDDTAVIYAPLTVQAACKYGSGSKWCIAATSGSDNSNPHFEDYSKHSNFYFLINKNMNSNDNNRDYKYALQWRFDGSSVDKQTWWDATDASHSEPPAWVTDKMMDAIAKFNPEHKKIKLKAQISSYVESPTWEKYKKFSDIIDPNQKGMVIDKIIKKGNLTSSAFVALLPDLSDEQKLDFITKYVLGTVTINDFKKMKDNLNTQQKYTLLISNPSIFNNYEMMKEMGDVFSDEQKYKLSNSIDSKLINNTDSKVLFRKWAMTTEEKEKHEETSFYVFLSTSENYIENLIKVNPLDPEAYRTINMLKLRIQVQPGTEMYGIKTDSGLLGPYLNTNTSSSKLSDADLEFIKEKAIKI